MKNHCRPFQFTKALAVVLLTLTSGFLTSAFAMTVPSYDIAAGKPEPTDNHADTIISSESSPNESDNQDNNEGTTTKDTNNIESDNPHQ